MKSHALFVILKKQQNLKLSFAGGGGGGGDGGCLTNYLSGGPNLTPPTHVSRIIQ